MSTYKHKIETAIASAALLLLAACGGGGGGGGGGPSGVSGVASGAVTAIGSVVVNGVRFDCGNATVTDDDGTIDRGQGDACVIADQQGLLKPGMVVTVTGTLNNDGTTGSADSVVTKSIVEGLVTSVDAANNSFAVMGQTVLVDDQTVFGVRGAAPNSLTTLQPNASVVEVSGFRDDQGRILATLVEVKSVPGNEGEIKGIVSVSTTGQITIGTLVIDTGGFSTPALTNGLCVELKGSFNAATNTLTLTRAPNPDNDCNGFAGGSLARAEVEGVITNFQSSSSFTVGGQPVSTSSGTRFVGGTADDLGVGIKVEVEGSVNNGVLAATKVQFKPGVRIEGRADANGSGNAVRVLGINVKTNANTGFKDGLTIADIQQGQRLRIRGFKSGPSEVTALRIEDRGNSGGGDTELRGPVDAAPLAPNFKILGVTVTTDGSTQFEDSNFFGSTATGVIVKAKGAESPDNVIAAREVERED